MSPYRTPIERVDATREVVARDCPDRDLLPVLLLFWMASVARVAFAVAHHETFGGEATLATLAVVLVPFMMREAGAWWLGRLEATVTRVRSLRLPYVRGRDR